MSSFIRRFSADPGDAVLTNIEAVDIIDSNPPATISGVGTGTVCLVGEFENGLFNTPTEVAGATDLLNLFGGLGFVTAGSKAANPCARMRSPDAGAAELWSGNGYVQLAGKRFARLVIVRVDTSVGSVVITPSSAPSVDTLVPAGTVVSNTVVAATSLVTMTNLLFPAGSVVAQTVKVRPALDDGTYLGAAASAVNTIGLAGFTVNNTAITTAALTETQLDAAYVTAIASTVDLNGVAHDINIITSARSANAIRTALLANALDASANGCLGRIAVGRAPFNATKAVAKQTTAPGVGATRSDRFIYCYPGVQAFLPTIAAVGTAGGTGFNATGIVNTGSNTLMASILSQLPPEENPGQATTFTANIIGIDSAANSVGYTMTDYISFRAAGVASPRVAGGTMIFQSGVTSVDPLVSPELRTIARRRMADFIQDTLSIRLQSFGKRLSTFARRKAIASEIRTFMNGLVSKNNPANQRIDSFSLDEKSGNTASSQALGIYRMILQVRTLSSLDAIVLQTVIGESVQVTAL
jgi:hypothetical protein